MYPILAPVFLGRELRKDCPLLSASQQALLSTVVFLTTLLIYWTTSGVWGTGFQDSIQTPASFSHYFPSLLFTFLFFLLPVGSRAAGKAKFLENLAALLVLFCFLDIDMCPRSDSRIFADHHVLFLFTLGTDLPALAGVYGCRAVPAQPSKKSCTVQPLYVWRESFGIRRPALPASRF